jgi:hypothetical protein
MNSEDICGCQLRCLKLILITYFIDDLGKSLLGEDLAATLIALDVIRCRVQTRNINFSRINSNAE